MLRFNSSINKFNNESTNARYNQPNLDRRYSFPLLRNNYHNPYMQRIYDANDLIEAHIIKGLLEQQDIEVYIVLARKSRIFKNTSLNLIKYF